MSKLSHAAWTLTAFFPKAEFTLFSSRHPGKCLHLPVRQVTSQGIVRSKPGNAARALEECTGRLNLQGPVAGNNPRGARADAHMHQFTLNASVHAGWAPRQSPAERGLLWERHGGSGRAAGGTMEQSTGSESAEERCRKSVKGKKTWQVYALQISFFLPKTTLLSVFRRRSVISSGFDLMTPWFQRTGHHK